jgi:carboxypeptidase Q
MRRASPTENRSPNAIFLFPTQNRSFIVPIMTIVDINERYGMMKFLIAFFLLAMAQIAPAQPMANPAEKGVAWDIVEGLTTEIGQRQAGTEAEARAREWSVRKLKALGFSNVRIEPYQMPTWVRGEERGDIIAPFPHKLAITALGNSAATPPSGITGDVAVFKSFEAFKAAPDAAILGKIVFVDHAMKPTQDGSSYGYFGPVRRSGPSLAAKRGAIAYVIRSVGTDNHRNPHTGNQNWQAGVTPIPAAAVSTLDANQIMRIAARGKPVRMKLLLTPKFLGNQPSGNVIAEVPGTDPAAGMVVIGGHLDSWDLGTGAIDDASGVAITAAAAKAILDKGKKPRRTIRVVWWGAEEVGLWGAKAYFEAHKAEPHALVAESDFGADRVWQVKYKLPEGAAALSARISAALADMGIATGKGDASGGADTGPLVEMGAPVIDLEQDGTRYFDIHHTPDDTLEMVDPVQLQQNVAAWTVMVDLVANAPEDLMAGQKR